MAQRLIVPVDGSSRSWVAADVAIDLAARIDATVHLVEVVFAERDSAAALSRLEAGAASRATEAVDIDVEAKLADDSAAAAIRSLTAEQPGSVVVMASHGRGRSAALVGSTAGHVLSGVSGPILLVGPHVESTDFSGPIVVSVDGSDGSKTALPVAAAWAHELGSTPWVVHVSDPTTTLPPGSDIIESGYPARLAQHLSLLLGHPVEFDELHDSRPDRAVCDFADRLGASLVVASSHSRTGFARLAMGSVVSGFVKHATCPVLVVRLAGESADAAHSDTTVWAP